MGAQLRNESTSAWSAMARPAAATPNAAPSSGPRSAPHAATSIRAARHNNHANAAAPSSPDPAIISMYMLLL